MFTINYDFEPSTVVYIVLNENELERGIVLNIDADVYKNAAGTITTRVTYAVLLDNINIGTVDLDSSNVFATLPEAADALKQKLPSIL